jgi:hypothetical protein
LTGLHPFVQRTPLLRYDTGDLVASTGPCETAGDFGIRFLGRAVDAVRGEVEGRLRVLVYPTDLYRIADELEGIARATHPVEELGIVSRCGLGAPKARALAAHDGSRTTVHVEVAVREGATAAERSGLGEILRQGLLSANEALRRHVALGGELVVRVVGACDLADRLFKP